MPPLAEQKTGQTDRTSKSSASKSFLFFVLDRLLVLCFSASEACLHISTQSKARCGIKEGLW